MSKLSQIRILTVDDEPDMAKLIVILLRQEYRDVIMATNGQTGIQKALEENPDIIVTDLMMPGVDGFTLIKYHSHPARRYMLAKTHNKIKKYYQIFYVVSLQSNVIKIDRNKGT